MGLETTTSCLKSIRMFLDFVRTVELSTQCPLSGVGVGVASIKSPPSTLIVDGILGICLTFSKSLC